jgi:hypothetical protein
MALPLADIILKETSGLITKPGLLAKGGKPMASEKRLLYLCAGMQSGGTTLVSWCFLQRRDMDGILDAKGDMLADPSPSSPASLTWLKTTVSCFRMSEQIAHFQDLGWTVKPLLVCRDVRAVYASLRTKGYGRNSTTSEDPPLRMRFRRFREDWELFQQRQWPILRFEEFLADPERVLRAACAELNLVWDAAMLTWPKPETAIRDTRFGNETFRSSRQGDLRSTLQNGVQPKSLTDLIVPPSELAWLEKEFAVYNDANGYPLHVSMQAGTVSDLGRAAPSFEASRRYARKLKASPLKYGIYQISHWLGATRTG